MTIEVSVGTILKAPNIISSVSVANPSSTTDDVTLLHLCMRGSGSTSRPNTPAGWTPLFGSQGAVAGGSTIGFGQVYWRAWQPGDPSSIALTAAGSAAWLVFPYRLRGADRLNPIEATAINNPGATIAAGGTASCSSVTRATATLLMCLWGVRAASGNINPWAAVPGMTQIASTHAGAASSNPVGMGCTKEISTNGATGAQGSTPLATSVSFLGFSLLINERVIAATDVRHKGGAPAQIRYKGQP